MISEQELTGGWTQIKGKIKEKWGQITDNELTQAEGSVEKLVGLLQRKTGTARREAEEFIEHAMSDGAKTLNRAASAAQNYASQATEAVSQGYEQVSHQVQQGYEQAEDLIRTRPAESLSVAFGAGIVTGILVTLMMRPSR